MFVLHFCVRGDDGRPRVDDSALLAFKRSYQRRLHSSAAQLLRPLRGGRGRAARLPAAPTDAQIAELLAASEEPTLSEQNFHVISFDYRGYGDSTGLPTEDGVVRDAITVFDHVRAQCPGRRIVLWGHSMGSGVAVRVAAELCAQRTPPHCLVLESAFNNLRDAMHAHPYSLPYRRFPLFELAVVRPLIRAGLVMCSKDRIKKVTCPILMLHAADDVIIPLRLGRLLYDARCRSNPLVQFVEFEPHRGLGHNSIYRALELATILTEFLKKCDELQIAVPQSS
ncbi:2-arachidonoylglycerol hydrolase ABHD12 [Aphelenchoides fujianensis]|nr:2-arachidonoylglycerol hydrolase ABHD12 [Aphelenchoides fujianensis]